MVLRTFVGLLILFFCSSAFAQISGDASAERLFSQAKQAYKAGRYEGVISLLNRRYNLKDPKTPGGVLALAAFAYEKLDLWKNAEKIYSYLITQRYRSKNSQIMGAYKNSGTDDLPEATGNLYQYYHRRAFVLSQIYREDYESLNPSLRELYKKTALMYVAILEESDYEDDSYDMIPEIFEKFDNEKEARKFHTSWYVQSSYVSWRDKLDLVYPDGRKATIESTGEGTCLGGGWRYENDYWEFNLNGCYAVGSMIAGKENSSLSYFQKGVTSTAIIAGPSALWKPRSKGAALGFSLPFVYRQGDYTEPTSFTLEDTTIFTYGLLLTTQWRFDKYGVFTKFGKVNRFSSSLWSLGLMYTF